MRLALWQPVAPVATKGAQPGTKSEHRFLPGNFDYCSYCSYCSYYKEINI